MTLVTVRTFATFLLIGVLFGMLPAKAIDITTNKQTISFTLPLLNGSVRTGEYAIRVSFWNQETIQTADLFSGTAKPNFDSKNYTGYSEQIKAQASAGGHISLVVGDKTPLPKIDKKTYIQIEFKPANTDPANYITLDAKESTPGIQRFPNTIVYKKNSFQEGDVIPFSGVLLGKDGQPETSSHMIRFSLWRSADIDLFFDQYPDGTLNPDASNFFYYVLEQEVLPDRQGRFSTDISFLINIARSLAPRDVFLQVEVRAKDGVSTYQLIDPDADRHTRIDRFNITGGEMTGNGDTSPQLSPIGNTGKWLASQIPAGTTRNNFELGLANTDPNAMIELRANQGQGKKGVLRFNGEKKKWEISSDGEVFEEIATGHEALKGTKEATFTIGLDDKSANKTWKLQFGGSINPATISYDPVRNTFQFNRNVDFGQNELINAVLENRSTAPSNPKSGQQYFNTNDRKAYYYDGSSWVAMSGGGGNTTYVYSVPSPTPTVNPTPVDNTGTPSNTFTFNNDLGGNPDVTLVAGQQTGNTGKLRYNGTTKQWEVSNDGTLFSAIADVSTPQAFTNKTIDGDLNTITNVDFSSLKPRSKTHSFTASYAGASLSPDGTNNKGVMETLFDNVAKYTYYAWTTSQGTMQDYDIVLSWKLPQDFVSFDTTPITFRYRTTSSNILNSFVAIDFLDGLGISQPLALTAPPTPMVNGWEIKDATFTGVPTLAPGDLITIKIKLAAVSGERAEIGGIDLNYIGK